MYDEETEELSEDLKNITGEIADLTKTANNPNGVSIFTDETRNTYKSTYQILKDISEIYSDLTDKQQAALLEKLGGKRGGQILAGIISDFSEVERAMSEIEQSAGSSTAEMSIAEETISFKLNALKNTWVSTLTSLTDRKDFGEIIEFLTSVSELLGEIINFGGMNGVIALAANIGTQMFFKNSLNIDFAKEIFTLDNAKALGSKIANWWNSAKKATEIAINNNPINNLTVIPDETQTKYYNKLFEYADEVQSARLRGEKHNIVAHQMNADIDELNANMLADRLGKKMDEVSSIFAANRGKHGQYSYSPEASILGSTLDFPSNVELSYQTIEDRLGRIKENAKSSKQAYTELMVDIVKGINDSSESAEEFGLKIKDVSEYFREMAGDDFSDQLLRIADFNPFTKVAQEAQDTIQDIAQEAQDTAINTSAIVEDTVVTMFEDMSDDIDEIPIVSGDQADAFDEAAEAEERLRAVTEAESASRQQNTNVTQQNTASQESNTVSRNADSGATEQQTIAADAHIAALAQELISTKSYSADEQNLILKKIAELGVTRESTVEELRLAASRIHDTDAISLETKAILNKIAAEKEEASIGNRLKNILTFGVKQLAIQAAFMALTWAVGKAIEAIKNYVNQEEILTEKSKEASTAIKEANDEFNNQSKSITAIKEEYAELAQGVSGLGTAFQKNETLSTEDYEKFLNLGNQLAELFPELKNGQDEYGNAIIDLKGNVDDINASLDDLLDKYRKVNQATIESNMPDIWENATSKVAKAVDEIKDLSEYRKEYADEYSKFINVGRNGQIWSNTNYGTYYDISKTLKSLNIDVSKVKLSTGPLGDRAIDLSKLSDDEYSQLQHYFKKKVDNYDAEIEKYENEIKQHNKEVSDNLKSWFRNDAEFSFLPKSFQNLALQIFDNVDMSNLPDDVDTFDKLRIWYEDHIVKVLKDIDNTDIQKAMSDVFSGNLDVKSLQDSCNEILDYLVNTLGLTDDNEIVITIKTKLDESTEKVERVYKKLFGKAKGKNGQKGLSASDWKWIKDTYGETIGSLTEDQLEQILSSKDIDLSDIYTNTEKVITKIHEFFQQEVDNQSPIDLKSWLETESPVIDDRGNNKTRQDLINDYYSLIGTLNEIKEKINTGEEVTVGDILGEVPDIYPYIERYKDFDEAIDHYILDKYDELKEKNGDMSSIKGAVEYWSKVIDETNKVLKTKKIDLTFNSEATVSDAVQHYEQSTELWLSTLSSSYDKLFEGGKFNYKNVDKDVIKSIKDDFENVEESLHIDISDDVFESLIRTLSNSKTTTAEAQKAFDDYATAMFYAAEGTRDLNSETADLMTKLLKDKGIVNADEVVKNYVSHQEKLQETVNKNSELYKQNQSDIQRINELKQAQAHASDTEAASLEKEVQAIQSEVNARQLEMAADQEAANKLFELQMAEQNLSLDNIDSSKDVAEIMKIAAACGSAIASFNSLKTWESDLKKVENVVAKTASKKGYLPTDAVKGMKDAVNAKGAKAYEDELKKQAESFTSAFDNLKFGPSASALDSAGGAGEELADAVIEGYQKELENLKWLRDNGK